MAYSVEVKERAYAIDPECWQSYSGQSREYKRAMEARRTATLTQAQKEHDAQHLAEEMKKWEGRNPRMESAVKSRILALRDEVTMYEYALGRIGELLTEQFNQEGGYDGESRFALMQQKSTLLEAKMQRESEIDALTVVYKTFPK